MKLKDFFRKNAKSIDTENFKAIDSKHLHKVAGGSGVTTDTTTPDPTLAAKKHIAGVKYED